MAAGKTTAMDVPEVVDRVLGEGTFSVEKFVESFGGLVEAAGGIGGLRTLAMQLAVQGRFTTCETGDGTAAQLLEGLRRHKSKLVSAKSIRGGQTVSENGIDPPFSIPATWVWTRFGEVGDWGSGSTPNRSMSAYFGGKTLWLKSGELNDGRVSTSEETITEKALKECSLRLNNPGDVLIAMYGATIGKTAILEVEATTNQAVCACTSFPGVFNEYLLLVLRAFKPLFVGQGAGGAQPNISKEKIVATPMPLPPFAEQKRIVARVDQLMALIDQLEAKQNRKREVGARFTKASLEALTTAESPQEFTTAWTLIQSTWATILDNSSKVGEVRKAVLELAVRGQLLTPTSDSTAISGSDVVSDAEVPFALPTGWRWMSLGDLATRVDYGTSEKAHTEIRGIPVIRMNNIQGGQLDLTVLKYVAENIDGMPDLLLAAGDLLFNRTNSFELVGKMAVFREAKKYTFASYLIRVRLNALAVPEYVNHYFGSWTCRTTQIEPNVTKQTNQANFNGTKLKGILVPLPPVAEQKRIVAKVEQLIKLCDALEAALRRSEDRAAKLVEAVVQEMVA